MIDGSSILITGGTGSFGQMCTKVLLRDYNLKRIVIFSRDEMKQWEMQKIFPKSKYPCMRYFVGDIRDKNRLYRAFTDIDIVIHAAAMKIVPTAEYNPSEVIYTNIIGCENIINAAIDLGVYRVIALSTDKAVCPANLYGATKLCSEKLIVAANSYTGRAETRMGVVRYGNVMGSRGSVIQLFNERRASGVLPITDERMTRFWITVEDGVRFVISSLSQMQGGEIFVPKLPSMSIMEMAKTLYPECRTEIIGIRPGEKLHELLVSADESRGALEYDAGYILLPNHSSFGKRHPYPDTTPIAEGFEYNSGTNPWRLGPEELKKIVATCS